jgi:hypothetical protein
MRRVPPAVAAMVAIAAFSAGCGGDDAQQHAPALSTVVAVDCSRSMKNDVEDWPGEITSLASATLGNLGRIAVGCFTGVTRTVKWTTHVSAWDLPESGDGTLQDRKDYGRLYGASLTKKFTLTLQPQDGVAGTNWLGALYTSLQEPHVHRVYLFSDLVQQAEGIDVTKALTRAQIEAAARPWAKRLAGLRTVPLYVIASGQGVVRTKAADRGRALLDAVAQIVGFTPTYAGSVPDPPDV